MSCCCAYTHWSVVHEYDYLHYVTMHAKSETDVAYLEDCTSIHQVLILKLSMNFNFMFLIFYIVNLFHVISKVKILPVAFYFPQTSLFNVFFLPQVEENQPDPETTLLQYLRQKCIHFILIQFIQMTPSTLNIIKCQ